MLHACMQCARGGYAAGGILHLMLRICMPRMRSFMQCSQGLQGGSCPPAATSLLLGPSLTALQQAWTPDARTGSACRHCSLA